MSHCKSCPSEIVGKQQTSHKKLDNKRHGSVCVNAFREGRWYENLEKVLF